MYSTICVKWAGDHFGLGLTFDPLFDEDKQKTIFTFSLPVSLTFDLQTSNLLPILLSSAMFPLN